jgi:hypothetical protein
MDRGRDQRRALLEEQNRVYEEAATADRERKERAERRDTLQNCPEERALLFDTLFLKRTPRYVPCLQRVKES